MISFPHFPTAFWALHHARRTSVIWEKGNSSLFPELSSRISWQQCHSLVLQAVIFLQNFANSGHYPYFKQNKIIAYSGENRLIGLLVYLAAIACGYRILVLNPALSDAQLRLILVDHRIDILITDQHFGDFFAKFSPKMTACNLVLPSYQPDEPATLTLTSGSSGKPKAVVHSISNHLYSAEGVCELMAFTAQDRWLLSLPLFHVSGQGIVWRWLSQGATLVINEEKSDFFRALSDVSHASLVPTQLQRYLQTQPLECSQHFLLGGSAIPAELLYQARQANISTYAGYGMTEMASTVCAVKNELDNVGLPLKHREIKLENGEIWVRGKPLALGYLQKNGKIQPLVNEQGWFQTKDLGEWNSQNRLVVKGRIDNMFISGGENIQPEEIEKILYQSDLIEQVFVLPIDDVEFGQRPVAFIRFKQEENNFADRVNKLQNWLPNKLEKFKHPIRYFPLNIEKYQQSGTIKISRNQLKLELTDLSVQEQ